MKNVTTVKVSILGAVGVIGSIKVTGLKCPGIF